MKSENIPIKDVRGGGGYISSSNETGQASICLSSKKDTVITHTYIKRVDDISVIKERIVHIKDLTENGFFTNFFVDDRKLMNWISKRQVSMLENDAAVVILRKRPDFYQCYFTSASLEALGIMLKRIRQNLSGVLVVAILGDVETYHDFLLSHGFIYHMGMSQMMRVNKTPGIPTIPDGVELAQINDAPEIQELLYHLMDCYCSQIPDLDEIEEMIQDKHFLVIRDTAKHKLKAFMGFDRRGVTVYGFFLAAREEYRHEMVAMDILTAYQAYTADAIRYIGWIQDDNMRSMKVNQFFGEKPNGFRQEVFLSKDGE